MLLLIALACSALLGIDMERERRRRYRAIAKIMEEPKR